MKSIYNSLSIISAIALRQIKRFFRARARAISTILMPIMWLVLFGVGFSTTFRTLPFRQILGTSYLSFLVPGIVCMTMFTSSFMAGVSVIWDRQFGFLKEVLVAPASRTCIIVGRIIGDVSTALIQASIIMILGLVMTGYLNYVNIPLALLYCILIGIVGAGLGTIIALVVNSFETFQALVSFIVLPLNFLSNIFYPLKYMPTWFKILTLLNPITYSTDALRTLLINYTSIGLGVDSLVLIIFAIAMISICTILFRRTTVE